MEKSVKTNLHTYTFPIIVSALEFKVYKINFLPLFVNPVFQYPL